MSVNKNKDYQTPLMLWIKERRGKTIPQDLYYPDYQTDKDRWCRTPLMIWVKYRRGETIP